MTHDDRTQPLVLPGFRDDMSDAFGPSRTRNESDGNRIIESAHEHNWIVRGLALGSAVFDAADVRALLREGVTHVLDLQSTRSAEPLYAGSGITYNCLPTPDDGTPRTLEWVRDGVRFACGEYGPLRGRDTGRILVHCAAGIHRSPAMVYAILRARGMREQRALDAITRNRRMARPARYLASVNEALARLGYV